MTFRFSPLRLIKRFLLRLLLACAVLWGGGVALFSIVPVPFSAVMLERQLGAWLSGNFHYIAHSDWVGMDEISPWMCGEVIVYAWMDRRRENSEKPYGTRLGAGQAVSARLVGK